MKKYVADFTKESIEQFLNNPIEEFKSNETDTYIKVSVDFFGPAPEFVYDDFTFKGINTYSNYDYSVHWRKYVVTKLNKSDQKVYVEEFNSNLDNQKLKIE